MLYKFAINIDQTLVKLCRTIPTKKKKKKKKKKSLFQVEEINKGSSLKAHAYSHMRQEKLSSEDTHSLYTFIKSEVRKWQS